MKDRNKNKFCLEEKDKQNKISKRNLQDARKQIQRNQKRRGG